MSNVLIVDDSGHILDGLRDILEKSGHNVWTASNGEQGLSIFSEKQDFDLVLSDLNMPIMDGMQMCQSLHSTYGNKLPPVLILSSEADPELKSQAKKFGVVGWIIKPYKEAVISGVVEKILDKYKKDS